MAAMYTIIHPEMSSKAAVRRYRDSLDMALADHRKKGLPRHFLRSAVGRYGGEYSKLKLRGRPKKQPLVITGRLRNAVQVAQTRFRGPASARSLVLPVLPRYLFRHRPGGFDKLKALEAVTAAEEDELGRNIDKHHAKILKKG